MPLSRAKQPPSPDNTNFFRASIQRRRRSAGPSPASELHKNYAAQPTTRAIAIAALRTSDHPTACAIFKPRKICSPPIATKPRDRIRPQAKGPQGRFPAYCGAKHKQRSRRPGMMHNSYAHVQFCANSPTPGPLSQDTPGLAIWRKPMLYRGWHWLCNCILTLGGSSRAPINTAGRRPFR